MSRASDIQYVDTPRRFMAALEAVRAAEHVAIDTEFIGESSYEPLLCLVQLATEAGIWILDPFAVSGTEPLWEALTGPDREFVALAAREEIRFCTRLARRPPARLLDLQIAAGLVGYGYPLSHTNLMRQALRIDVHGRETFTDWRRRPLSAAQIEYAADDVRYLLPLRERLLSEARPLGREEWIESESRRLIERVQDAEGDERWRRVAGSASLKRRDLAVLRELWEWRDEQARTADAPPRRIMRDEMLVEVAKRRPTSVADLHALRGLDRGAARKEGPEIVRAVQRGLDLPDADLPHVHRRDDPPQVPVLSQLLGVVANGLAAQHRVDPGLLSTSSDLQELVRWRLGHTSRTPEPFLLQGWRGEILGHTLLEILDGKRTLRVADVKSPNPLICE